MIGGRLRIRHVAPRLKLRNAARRRPVKPAWLLDLEGAQPEIKTCAAKPSNQPCKTVTPSRLPYLDGHHDLLAAAVQLGSLEERIGYTFSDKLLGLTVFKAPGIPRKLRFEGVTKSIESNHRLALLGDKVLYLVLAKNWYESGRPPSGYARLDQQMVTRWALAYMAAKLGLQRNFWGPGFISGSRLGETFEALIGAIYVDSHHNLNKVEDFLTAIDFYATMELYVEAEMMRGPLSNGTPTEPKSLTSASTTSAPEPQPGYIKDEKTAAVSYDIQKYLRRFAAIPYISSIYEDLATFKDVNDTTSESPLSKLVEALGKYAMHFVDTADLCAWFPKLRARYLRLFDSEHMFRAEWLRARRKTRCVKDALRPDESSPELLRSENFDMLVRFYWYAAEAAANVPLDSHSRGNLVMNLRRRTILASRDLFLTACRVEETARDRTRKAAGLPDWYDLPEHRDKVLPPWRVSAKINDTLTASGRTHSSCHGHSPTRRSVSVVREQPAEASDATDGGLELTQREAGTFREERVKVAVDSAIIPMEIVRIEQATSQPPLLLDTARRTGLELFQPEDSHAISFSTMREQESQLLPTQDESSTQGHLSDRNDRSLCNEAAKPKEDATKIHPFHDPTQPKFKNPKHNRKLNPKKWKTGKALRYLYLHQKSPLHAGHRPGFYNCNPHQEVADLCSPQSQSTPQRETNILGTSGRESVPDTNRWRWRKHWVGSALPYLYIHKRSPLIRPYNPLLNDNSAHDALMDQEDGSGEAGTNIESFFKYNARGKHKHKRKGTEDEAMTVDIDSIVGHADGGVVPRSLFLISDDSDPVLEEAMAALERYAESHGRDGRSG